MNKITIRAFEMGDWAEVATLFLSPNCRWGTLQMPYQSRDDIKERLLNAPKGLYRLVAVETKTNKVVGMIGLHTNPGRRAHVAGIGMMVHETYQNEGVGSKLVEAAIDLAENWLRITRIELTVYVDNKAAIHLYKKFNFVVEGTHHQYGLRDGDYVDVYAMARLRVAK